VIIDKREYWSRYWHQGHLTSLPCGFATNYDGEFLGFWEAQFALLNCGERILDVCSGNGAIALLAQDYSQRNALDLKVKAVDAADIDVTALVAHNLRLAPTIQAIEFVPNTLLEDMVEESESVNLVTSQFGIEYTDWNLSAKNIGRILKSGGYFSLVCHHSDTKIVARMEVMQREYAQLCNMDIFSREPGPENATDFPAVFIRRLDNALDTIYDMFQNDRSSEVLSGIGGQLDKILELTVREFHAGFQRFLQLREGVIISYATSSDLLALNRRLQEFPDWFEVFIEEGLELLRSGDIHYHTGETAGKSYQFRKPA